MHDALNDTCMELSKGEDPGSREGMHSKNEVIKRGTRMHKLPVDAKIQTKIKRKDRLWNQFTTSRDRKFLCLL